MQTPSGTHLPFVDIHDLQVGEPVGQVRITTSLAVCLKSAQHDDIFCSIAGAILLHRDILAVYTKVSLCPRVEWWPSKF